MSHSTTIAVKKPRLPVSCCPGSNARLLFTRLATELVDCIAPLSVEKQLSKYRTVLNKPVLRALNAYQHILDPLCPKAFLPTVATIGLAIVNAILEPRPPKRISKHDPRTIGDIGGG